MFWLLCFVSCVVKRHDGDIKRKRKNGDVSILVRVSYFSLLPFLSACPDWDIVFCVRMFCVLCFKLWTLKFSVLAFLCPVLFNGVMET